MGTHSGEKSYQCSQCDMTFSHNDILKSHMRIHTEDKPYQCNQCDMSFSDNSNFIIHMRAHTGERSYQCNQCDMTFSDNDILKKHIRTHKNYISVIQPVLHMQHQYEPITFKGIKLVNPPGENLCYINATVNAFLKCKSIMNLVQSNLNCYVINILRCIHNNELSNGPEYLRNLLIANGHDQFNNKDQMDPDEFMRFLLELSQSLTDICNITITYTDTCIACSEVSQVSNDCVGVHASINDDSIESIIKKDMDTSVHITYVDTHWRKNIFVQSM